MYVCGEIFENICLSLWIDYNYIDFLKRFMVFRQQLKWTIEIMENI